MISEGWLGRVLPLCPSPHDGRLPRRTSTRESLTSAPRRAAPAETWGMKTSGRQLSGLVFERQDELVAGSRAASQMSAVILARPPPNQRERLAELRARL